MVTKQEARLYYKNAIIKKLYIGSYVFLGIFGVLLAIISGIGLIVENGQEVSGGFLYVALGVGLVSFVVAVILLCFSFINDGNGMSFLKANIIFGIKLFLRVVNLLGGLVLLLGSFIANIGFDVGNDGWGHFVRAFALIIIVIEGVMCLYNIWNIAWRKENPERYMPGLYIKKIEEIEKNKALESSKKKHFVHKQIDNSSPKQLGNEEPKQLENNSNLLEKK